MRTTIFALFCAPLVLSCNAAPVSDAPAPDIAPPPPSEPARTTAPPPKEAAIRAIDGVVPADVTVSVHQETESRWALRVRRKGHLVALRQGVARGAGEGEAELPFAVSGAPDRPIVWETTDPSTLVTTRGLVELATDGATRLLPAEAPAIVASETRRLHACAAHEDGVGGFTVICRVHGVAEAVNLTRDSSDPIDAMRMWRSAAAHRTLLRTDLDASPGADAIALGYADGATGVVVRAEATHVAGEARPSIIIQSAERAQPIVHRTKHLHFDDIELF